MIFTEQRLDAGRNTHSYDNVTFAVVDDKQDNNC
jgi:hypothetical protein